MTAGSQLDPARKRRDLINRVRTLPESQVSRHFEQLILSYDQSQAGAWARMKEDGILDLILDLLDPPKPRKFDVSIGQNTCAA